MALSIDALKSEQILYAENIVSLRSAIAHKYPEASSKEQADLLAKAMKRILYTNLSSFEESLKTSLVHDLLRTALQKQDFSINAHDVISSYTALTKCGADDLTPLTPLTLWLSETTGKLISSEEITSILFPHALCSNDETLPLTSPPPLEVSPSETCLESLEEEAELLSCSNATSVSYKKMIFTVSTLCIAASTILLITSLKPVPQEITPPVSPAVTEAPLTFLIPEADYLMPHLQYKEINQTALKEWLLGRHSLLAQEPYFSTIIDAAMQYNINPLLMFAITGQEQGFVPQTNKHALKIANNPFNVYGSWEDFNTDIEDTSLIAARTIINLSKGCPPDADPIKWLNQKYAEDPNWHKGVTAIFNQLEETAGQ